MARTRGSGGGNSHDRKVFRDAVAKAVEDALGSSQTLQHAKPPNNRLTPSAQSSFERAFRAVEHPFVQTPISVIGGIVGVFVYGPVLMLCSISVFAGVHRSGALNGLQKKAQFVAWTLIVTVVLALLRFTGHLIEIHRDHIPTLGEITGTVKNAIEQAISSSKQSRIEVQNITVAKDKRDRPGAGLNIFYMNAGTIPATHMSHHTDLRLVTQPLTAQQVEDIQEAALKELQSPDRSKGEVDITPGNPAGHYFTIPDAQDLIRFESVETEVEAKRSLLYVFETFKYRDEKLQAHQIRIAQFCGWFYGNFDMWHNCGITTAYTAVDD